MRESLDPQERLEHYEKEVHELQTQIRFLEDEARKAGAKLFTLNAQVSARRFYEKAGYRAIGSIFDDAHIPHVRMDRTP